MKVLMVNKLYYPWIGGVEKVVQQIAEGLNGKENFEISIFCCQAKGRGKEEVVNGVKVYRVSSLGIFWGMPVSFDFFRLFKKLSQEVDLIVFHHPFPWADLALFLFRPKAKLIIHYHSDIVRQKIFNFLVKPFINHTLKKAEKIIVSNPNLIKNSPYLKNFQGKCQVIPFGVDLKKFKKTPEQEEEIQKIKEKYGNFILFVGRLVYYKGINYLIEAMREVKANLIIIGKGPLKSKFKVQSSKLKIDNKIFLLPFVEENDLINFFHACQLLVLPSILKSEAFGIVLIEAMACGKPVISTELGTGTSWVNQNEITGFVVPPKNSQALFIAIQKIVNNKKLAIALGQNAQQRVMEHFSLQKMLKETEEIYKTKNQNCSG